MIVIAWTDYGRHFAALWSKSAHPALVESAYRFADRNGNTSVYVLDDSMTVAEAKAYAVAHHGGAS